MSELSNPRVALYCATKDACPRRLLKDLHIVETDHTRPQHVDLLLHWDGTSLGLKDLREPRARRLTVGPRKVIRRRAKRGLLARAVGPRSRYVVDATAGWGGDTLLLYEMGYRVTAIERQPLLAALLRDGFRRLHGPGLTAPEVMEGEARDLLGQLQQVPDCIYLDPMFPPKRRASALARRELRLLRELTGDDPDASELLNTALASAPRVVVKRPDHVGHLGRRPDVSFAGKLVRYDVYLAGRQGTLSR